MLSIRVSGCIPSTVTKNTYLTPHIVESRGGTLKKIMKFIVIIANKKVSNLK